MTNGPRSFSDSFNQGTPQHIDYRARSTTMPAPINEDDFFQLDGFNASSMKQEEKGLIPQPESASNYLGKADSLSARLQVKDLPDDENCCLWITKIHPSASMKDFLSTIRTGAIYAVSMSDAQGDYTTKAAKVVFKKHQSAADFLRQVQKGRGVYINNLRMVGIWNRHGYREATVETTRVLHLRGPIQYMDPDRWVEFFKTGITLVIEHTRDLPEHDPLMRSIEIRFCRVDGQAESGWYAVRKNKKMASIIDCQYGPDPCDPYSGFV